MRIWLAALVMVVSAWRGHAQGLCWYDAVERNATSPYGLISWHADLTHAQTQARTTGKPMLVLSGADTPSGRTFARVTLSFFFIVDGAEAFVPALKRDGKVGLEFCAGDGTKLTETLANNASIGQVLVSMTRALVAAKCAVPEYLRMAAVSYGPANRQSVCLGFG